ncbi:aspartic peptidase domain-containing protein [Leucosporidium creatinivorum]|uniref:Aspartic peptidase domain-containing protein n=1 Tax=Leucosporidium creatinivorum TaxID=106004 RepID=A0A1Y2G0Z6_9BASI|nr:aspartic peptidase domain-containing protein [Leucosporidium creatinivorum]
MHTTTPPPFPFLLLLSLLFNPSVTTASPSPSPSPNPLPSPSPTPFPHLPPPGGLSLPLHRRSSSLLRRSDPETIRSWALREKGRITGKYGPSEGQGEVEKRQLLRERATTALSVARLPSTTSGGSASRTTSANSSSATASHTVGRVDVMNFEADLAYYATVGVGVPPQYINTILDTGSADLWIADSTCTTSTGCNSITTLNSSSSTTAVDMNTSFSVKYGSGSASGDIWQDYVSFAGYNVSSQAFALVDTVSTDLLSGNLSGLMGLGWQPLAASGVTPFWQNLYQAGVLPFPGFAFALTRFVNVTTASAVEPGGLLTFGYLNTTLFQGEINYVDIPDGLESYWVVQLEGVSLYRMSNATNSTTTTTSSSSASSTTLSSATFISDSLPIAEAASTSHPTLQRTNITMDSAMVAIDTGTTLIGGPKDLVEQVYAGIEGSLAATGDYAGYYSYPCAAEVNVSLTFGGVSYNMTSDDFNLGPFGTTNNVSTCLGAFFDLSLSSTSKITWVIGAAFLKNVFSVFRASPPSVGFALLSSGNSSAADIYNSTSGTPISRGSNLTQIPTGIYGPSGATSLRSATEQEITTAIQAGQTVSRLPSDGAGMGSGAGGRRVGGAALGGAAALVLGAAWVLL